MCWMVDIRVEGVSRAAEGAMGPSISAIRLKAPSKGKQPILEGAFPSYTIGPHCACDFVSGKAGTSLDALLPLLEALLAVPDAKAVEVAWAFAGGPDDARASARKETLSAKTFSERSAKKQLEAQVCYRISPFV